MCDTHDHQLGGWAWQLLFWGGGWVDGPGSSFWVSGRGSSLGKWAWQLNGGGRQLIGRVGVAFH